MHPANVPYVLIGTGALWFGWFGFNAAAALAANLRSIAAFANTNMAAAAAGFTVGWPIFKFINFMNLLRVSQHD